LSKGEVGILYAGIVTCMIALAQRKSWLFLVGLLWFVGFTTNRLKVNKKRSETRIAYLYDVYGKSIVDIFDGDKVYTYPLSDQLLLFAGHDSIYQYQSAIPVDYVIIQDNYIGDLYKMREYFDIRRVVVDGSNRYDTKQAIRKQCYHLRLAYHDTQYGALEIIDWCGFSD